METLKYNFVYSVIILNSSSVEATSKDLETTAKIMMSEIISTGKLNFLMNIPNGQFLYLLDLKDVIHHESDARESDFLITINDAGKSAPVNRSAFAGTRRRSNHIDVDIGYSYLQDVQSNIYSALYPYNYRAIFHEFGHVGNFTGSMVWKDGKDYVFLKWTSRL